MINKDKLTELLLHILLAFTVVYFVLAIIVAVVVTFSLPFVFLYGVTWLLSSPERLHENFAVLTFLLLVALGVWYTHERHWR